jgi:transcriptional regulator with PAS, ATPase and Fis domain
MRRGTALKLQVKLLALLPDRSVLRVGGTSPVKIDCRVIAGTNRDLEEMIENKEFRLDLFYRLNVVRSSSAAAEHREDIPALMNHFINIINQKYG